MFVRSGTVFAPVSPFHESAPAPPAPEASDDEVDAHVTAALAEGLSTRDAAARVARDLRVPRRRTYDAATRLKPKRP